jgi:hypothetical protein
MTLRHSLRSSGSCESSSISCDANRAYRTCLTEPTMDIHIRGPCISKGDSKRTHTFQPRVKQCRGDTRVRAHDLDARHIKALSQCCFCECDVVVASRVSGEQRSMRNHCPHCGLVRRMHCPLVRRRSARLSHRLCRPIRGSTNNLRRDEWR